MQNVDPSEVSKFEAIASRWWDLNGEFKPLHDMNPLRLNYIASHVSLAGKKIIDVGCGGGILTEAMASQGAIVTGIDAGEATIAAAKHHAQQMQCAIDYRAMTAEAMAAQHPHTFDIVTCMELLEHVPDPRSLIQACATLVAPGGWVFFSTINRTLKSYAYAIVGAEYILRLLPAGTHDYAKFIRPSELAQRAREAGLTMHALKGMHYHPFTQVFTLSDNVDVNYFAVCRSTRDATA